MINESYYYVLLGELNEIIKYKQGNNISFQLFIHHNMMNARILTMILILRQTLVIISHIVLRFSYISVTCREYSRNSRICMLDNPILLCGSMIHNDPSVLLCQILSLSLIIIIINNFGLLRDNYDNIYIYIYTIHYYKQNKYFNVIFFSTKKK